jgi:hypothetical protein
MKLKTSIAALLLLSWNASVFAEATSAGAFLKIDPSARSYATGQSGVVSALGAESIGVNPANMMDMSRKMELLTSYTSMTDGVSYGHLAGSINRSTKKDLMVDAIGFSYTRLSVSGLEGRDSSGNRTSDFGTADSQMSMSLAGDLGKFRLGITGKIVQSKIAAYKANNAMAMDLGLGYGFKAFGKSMDMGASVSNLGQKMKYIEQQDSLPTTFNLGLATNFGPLRLMGGLHQQMKGGTTMNLGAEFNLSVISLRAGMNAGGVSGNKAEGTSGMFEGFSSGLGIKLGLARIDYALGQASADLGLSHRMSLTLQFGAKAK